VSPIVARVFAISDGVEITELHDVFLSMLGWQHDLGFIIRVHGQKFIVTNDALAASDSAIFSCVAKRNFSILVTPWISGNGRSGCWRSKRATRTNVIPSVWQDEELRHRSIVGDRVAIG